jgi:hypothetical protein
MTSSAGCLRSNNHTSFCSRVDSYRESNRLGGQRSRQHRKRPRCSPSSCKRPSPISISKDVHWIRQSRALLASLSCKGHGYKRRQRQDSQRELEIISGTRSRSGRSGEGHTIRVRRPLPKALLPIPDFWAMLPTRRAMIHISKLPGADRSQALLLMHRLLDAAPLGSPEAIGLPSYQPVDQAYCLGKTIHHSMMIANSPTPCRSCPSPSTITLEHWRLIFPILRSKGANERRQNSRLSTAEPFW